MLYNREHEDIVAKSGAMQMQLNSIYIGYENMAQHVIIQALLKQLCILETS